MWLNETLIFYCSKRALKCKEIKEMFATGGNNDYRYACGIATYREQIWLKRISWLSKTFKQS
jgi:hypothetical protein